MKVLFATGEAFPFVKTGGLGDVSYSLPKTLVQKEKIDVRVILPKYSKISSDLLKNAKHQILFIVMIGNQLLYQYI